MATEAKRIGVGGIRKARPRSRSHPKNDPQRNTRTGGWSALSARRAVTQARRWTEESHRKGRGATSRFGKDAGAEGRSAEPGQMDEQVCEQAEGSPHQPRTHDWRDRHPQDVKSDGIFAQSQQEEDGRDVACRPGRPISAHQSHRESLRSQREASHFRRLQEERADWQLQEQRKGMASQRAGDGRQCV